MYLATYLNIFFLIKSSCDISISRIQKSRVKNTLCNNLSLAAIWKSDIGVTPFLCNINITIKIYTYYLLTLLVQWNIPVDNFPFIFWETTKRLRKENRMPIKERNGMRCIGRWWNKRQNCNIFNFQLMYTGPLKEC